MDGSFTRIPRLSLSRTGSVYDYPPEDHAAGCACGKVRPLIACATGTFAGGCEQTTSDRSSLREELLACVCQDDSVVMRMGRQNAAPRRYREQASRHRVPHARDRSAKEMRRAGYSDGSGGAHIAQSSRARPLVYDFMECFRVVMVDEVVVKFLHMKKLPISEINQNVVQDFLHDLYMILDRKHYHRGRSACISVSYWIDLTLLEFQSAVSEKRLFAPQWMPTRHETRCNRKPPNDSEVK